MVPVSYRTPLIRHGYLYSIATTGRKAVLSCAILLELGISINSLNR